MPKPKTVDLMRLEEVCPMLKELTGVTRTRATIYNWARKGRANVHGVAVKLHTYKRLGQLYTTQEAVLKFLREIA